MKPRSANPSKTVLVIIAGLLVVYYFSGWPWTLYTALIIGVGAALSDYLAGVIHFLWMKLVLLLSLIVPNVIMTLIFYLILFPIAMLARLFRKHPPILLTNPDNSVFVETDKSFDKSHFEKPW